MFEMAYFTGGSKCQVVTTQLLAENKRMSQSKLSKLFNETLLATQTLII